jgi:hypothetical protein
MNWWDFPLNLIVGNDPVLVFFISLGAAWLLTPGLMIIIARIFESRWLPLMSDKQFRGFFPGDLFLGVMFAFLLAYATQLPEEGGWYTSWTIFGRIVVLLVSVGIAYGLTNGELKSESYTKAQIYSPTKLYHNGVLYVGYVYIMVSTLIHVLIGAPSWWLLLVVVPGFIWMFCNVLDGRPRFSGDEPMKRKAATAHIADWKPIWR